MTHAPTDEQSLIIAAVSRGESIIVNALAGAAKSTTIEMAAKASPADPSDLALAFNKSIQMELEPRLPCKVQTLNSLGHQAWAKFAGRMELDSGKVSKILKRLDPQAPWELSRLVAMAKLNGLVPKERLHLGQGLLDDTPNVWEDLASDLDLDLWRLLPNGEKKDLLPLVRQALCVSIDEAFGKVIDFDDQVYMPTCFGAPFPAVRRLYVDEAQDLSPLNHLMLKRIGPQQLVAVGDPLQSIYAFRGADTRSMPKLATDWKLTEYTLSVCFRCSKAVARAASEWAWNIKSPEWAAEGLVVHNPTTGTEDETWNFSVLPPANLAVLCRNNAPLIKLALKVFRKRKIAFISNKGEQAMLSSLRKMTAYKKTLSLDAVLGKIEGWRMQRLDTEDPKKHERIMDEADALIYCAEAARKEGLDYMGLERLISSLFQNSNPEIVFATGHGAKGKEWDSVLHLDPWRLPSKWAKTEEALQQEANIHYVITTRAKIALYHAGLDSYDDREAG